MPGLSMKMDRARTTSTSSSLGRAREGAARTPSRTRSIERIWYFLI